MSAKQAQDCSQDVRFPPEQLLVELCACSSPRRPANAATASWTAGFVVPVGDPTLALFPEPQRLVLGVGGGSDVLDLNGSGKIGYAVTMSRFGGAARRYLLDRALGGRRTRRSHVQARRRGRFDLWGPVPYYSTRTRRGSEVSVGGCGCCLPISLIGALSTVGALRALWRRMR